MWIEKLTCGVLELDTPIGPRYLDPNFVERALLLWTFRNFFSLPHQVLRPSEVRLIDRLSSENRFVSASEIVALDRPIIGRVERRAPAPVATLPMRKPAASTVPDRQREAASA